ncbi:Serine aminopeptidase S33 [Gracilaria domingensis]|nr:Serine aminopeptidase S33 [Gracilaria domingensis]
MCLLSFAVRLLRVAGEAFFFFELNRLFGRLVTGSTAHRTRSIRVAERAVLQHVRVPMRTVRVSLPSSVQIDTIVAGMAAVDSRAHGDKPLVLLHGHSMAAASFFRNIDHFLNMGFTSVFIPDLSGWASSSRPCFNGQHIIHALDFFLNPFHHWSAELCIARFMLLGHSLGAYLEYKYSLLYPFRVTALVLTSPAAIARRTPVSLALCLLFLRNDFSRMVD